MFIIIAKHPYLRYNADSIARDILDQDPEFQKDLSDVWHRARGLPEGENGERVLHIDSRQRRIYWPLGGEKGEPRILRYRWEKDGKPSRDRLYNVDTAERIISPQTDIPTDI